MSENPSSSGTDRLLSGQAWDDFCEQVRQAGHMIDRFGETPDRLDKAEWYRFVTRLMRNGLERFMENCEPERPRLREVSWRQAINFQSPDQDHLLSEFVDGSHDYRITGNRGTIPYFVIASWTAQQPLHPGERDWAPEGVASLAEFDPALLKTTGFLQSDTIHFDEQGDFEIIVSREQPADGRDWLPITEDCVGLLVRNVYHERDKTVAPVMRIERCDDVLPREVSPPEVSDGLAKAAQTVLGYSELVRNWWQDNLSQRPNRVRFSREVYLSNGGVPDRHHGFGTWECAADEALVIDFTPTPCDYWIFQLCNMWQENLDNYEEGDGYVQKFTARHAQDGRIRIVVSEQDPGFDTNWISPFGHRHGGMSLRLIKTDGEPPQVTLRRVPIEQLQERGVSALENIEPIVSGELTA